MFFFFHPITEKQRRNSLKSPRSRSGSDAIGRSPSSLSLSSTDSHESGGLPVSHGRTASWSSSQNFASQVGGKIYLTTSGISRIDSPQFFARLTLLDYNYYLYFSYGKTWRSPWRNRLARSAVNRKVGGSSPPGDDIFSFLLRDQTFNVKRLLKLTLLQLFSIRIFISFKSWK